MPLQIQWPSNHTHVHVLMSRAASFYVFSKRPLDTQISTLFRPYIITHILHLHHSKCQVFSLVTRNKKATPNQPKLLYPVINQTEGHINHLMTLSSEYSFPHQSPFQTLK